jgi:hypothetical protein
MWRFLESLAPIIDVLFRRNLGDPAFFSDSLFEGKKYDPSQIFAKSFGVFRSETAEKVRLRFERQAASYVRERRWHESRRVISSPEGRIELQLETGLTPDLVNWVLGFGAAAELSRRSGVPKQVLSLCLAGVEPRKLSHLKKVASVLGTTIDALCFGEQPSVTVTETQAFQQDTWFEGVFEGRIRKVLVIRTGRD